MMQGEVAGEGSNAVPFVLSDKYTKLSGEVAVVSKKVATAAAEVTKQVAAAATA